MLKLNRCAHGILVLFLVNVLAATAPLAAEAPKNYTANQLGEIVVSAKRQGVESVGTVRQVTAEEIKMSGADSLDDALRLLPGLNIRTGAAGTPRIDIRGMRSRHVKILLNGIPFNSTYDGQFDPSFISVEHIARIKVSYGNSSVLYGDGALGGIINIITKKGIAGSAVEATLETGSNNSHQGTALISGGNNKVRGFLSGNLTETDGYTLSEDYETTPYQDGGLRLNSDRQRGHVFGNLTYSPSDSTEVGLTLDLIQGEYGIPPSIYDSTDPFASNPKYERVDDQDGISGQLSASHDFSGPFSMRGWVYLNDLEENKNRYDDKTTSSQTSGAKGLYRKDDTSRVTGANLQTRYDFKSADSLTLALGTERAHFHSIGEEVLKKNKPFVPFDVENETETHFGALEYEWFPTDQLGLVFGYGYHSFDKDTGSNESDDSFLVGSHYDLSTDTRISGALAKKIRFPSIKQLYDTTYGNPDLKAEESLNLELKLAQTMPYDTDFSITGFYIDMENYIEKDGTTPYANHDNYLFQGVEFTTETHYVEDLMLRLGYTYMQSEDKSPGTQKEELQYRPEHKFTLDGRYAFAYGFSAYASLEHLADMYYYSRKLPLQKGKLDDFTVVNLRVTKDFMQGRLSCYIEADNLFDENYSESYGFPQAGRMVYGGITANWF
jgi:vitamin B12 transporter